MLWGPHLNNINNLRPSPSQLACAVGCFHSSCSHGSKTPVPGMTPEVGVKAAPGNSLTKAWYFFKGFEELGMAEISGFHINSRRKVMIFIDKRCGFKL